jgi:CDP-glucose 4,6-dehydratase
VVGTFARHVPDVVIHLAAQPLVRRSFAEPRATYETNVMGTIDVLEAVRASP